MRSLALVVLVALTGCDLYFGGGGDDDPCNGGPYGGQDAAAFQLRNPQTGLCETIGGGGWGCDDRCGPCPYAELSIALPDWGYCSSHCEALDEASCLTTSGCIAAYDEYAPYADAPASTTFKGCWATAQSGPIQGGGCWDLDAQECSRHDDCALFYGYVGGIPPNALVASTFSRCGPEPTTQGCSAVDCGPGYRCEEQCYPCDGKTGPCDPYCTPMCVPDAPACANVLCGPGFECVEVCDVMPPTPNGPLPPGHCYPACVPVGGGDPGACTGDVWCDALPPACPANTVPGILDGCWSGYCIPQHACGPNDPGTCEAWICDLTAPPACPQGTVPGVLNCHYTGYCIPDHACGATSCELLTTEGACSTRPDCTPVYTGGDCTCYPTGCTCEDLTFARCESWGVMPF